MAILSGDIKLVASQVMDDVPEGGGAPTSSVIADAVSNAIFPDISELDRAGGRVNLRKVFATVQSDNTDTYLGENVIVAEPPEDPNVSITLFSTGNTFDERNDAKSRMESYLAPGPEWGGILLENHIEGQRSVQIFQRVGSAPPPVGRTLVLINREGESNEVVQYVRITAVSIETRTFSYSTGGGFADYVADVMSCDISDALRYDFPGTPPNRGFQKITTASKIRDTIVADAAYYAGVVPLTEAVAIGDLTAKCSTIFTQLVPSAQTEIPIVDRAASGNAASVIETASADISYTSSESFGPGTTLTLGNAVKPGSLNITTAGSPLTDAGGVLLSGATAVGTVSYADGLVVFGSEASTYGGTKTVTFRPAGAPLQHLDTTSIAITAENRAYNYNLTIVPPPAPGTTSVSYLSNGKWYDLTDNGAGVMRGRDSAFGAGTVSYSTGTVSLTLGALPDAGGALLYSWGSKATYLNRSAVSVASPKLAFTLGHTNVTPGSVDITWNDGTARTASDDGSGLFTGDATGRVRYLTGEVELTPSTLPSGSQTYTINYNYGVLSSVGEYQETDPPREVDTTIILDVGTTNLTPGSVEVEWALVRPPTAYASPSYPLDLTKMARDNGAGVLKVDGVTVGSVNYTAGTLQFQPNMTIPVPELVPGWAGAIYSSN